MKIWRKSRDKIQASVFSLQKQDKSQSQIFKQKKEKGGGGGLSDHIALVTLN